MELEHEKNGGPYTKDEQRKRRDEVYRLHFEYGYSARKIAEFLKVNRGTINRDIMQLYANIANKWRHLDPEVFVRNQVERLELQRTRLRKQLDKVESFHEKIIVEKIILDIDMKITNLQIRLVETTSNIHKRISDGINEWQKEEKSGKRVFLQEMFFEVSEKAYKKLYNIYKEDMKF
ncbi:MAG: hypothetical protein EPO37_05465 [Nitrosarchaeum sp.]|nr:MAG: hypothetical protein EPO37_05465 [Nitrosarchaeum sp.]